MDDMTVFKGCIILFLLTMLVFVWLGGFFGFILFWVLLVILAVGFSLL